jgi:DNA-binding MurR/RpiR family transcriptional regulator
MKRLLSSRSKSLADSGQAPTVAERTRHAMASLTRTEQRIARVLLANYPVVGLETASQFGARAQTSAPSVLRFVAKLGITNYAEFQQLLRSEMQQQLQSPLMRHSPTATLNANHSILEKFAEITIENIRRSIQMVSDSEFEAITLLLANSKRPVLLIGGRFSMAIAQSFYTLLAEMRPNVQLVQGQTATWALSLLNVTRRHVVIVFDFRRYQRDLEIFAVQAAERGATVAAFTDEWLSGVARVARQVLMARVATPSLYDSTIASQVQAEAIIAALGARLNTTVEKRIRVLEALRHEAETRYKPH